MKEVYIAYGRDKEVLYVGQGNIGRHNHCLNGTSHSQALNRYFFMNGEENSIRVEVVKIFKSEKEALHYEDELIILHNPLFNIKSSISNQASYMLDTKDFYKRFESELIKGGLKLHSHYHAVWMNRMKTFVKCVGYKRLKDGAVLSRASMRNYKDDGAYSIFARLIKGQVNPIFSESFEIKKEKEAGFYFIKLVAWSTIRQ